MRFDETDLKILELLLRSAATAKAEIGRAVGIAASAISERIRQLEEAQVIRHYETRLDARQLGFRTLAFVFVAERKPTQGVDTGELLSRVTGVEEVHRIAGEDCFMIKIRARDTDELAQILEAQVNPIKTVAGTKTTIVLRTVKEDVALGGVGPLSKLTLD